MGSEGFFGARIGKTLLDIHRNNISIFPIVYRQPKKNRWTILC